MSIAQRLVKPPKEQAVFAETSETLRFHDRDRTKLWKDLIQIMSL
jgi:hypothetical protein